MSKEEWPLAKLIFAPGKGADIDHDIIVIRRRTEESKVLGDNLDQYHR